MPHGSSYLQITVVVALGGRFVQKLEEGAGKEQGRAGQGRGEDVEIKLFLMGLMGFDVNMLLVW